MRNLFITNLHKKDVNHFTTDTGLFLRKKLDKPFKKTCNLFTNANIIRVNGADGMTDEEYYSSLSMEQVPRGKDNIEQASRFALQEDYAILYGCLEVAVSLLKERHISREDWSTLHGVIKSYLIDRPNRDKEDYTAYTDPIYSWCEDIFEEINTRHIHDGQGGVLMQYIWKGRGKI